MVHITRDRNTRPLVIALQKEDRDCDANIFRVRSILGKYVEVCRKKKEGRKERRKKGRKKRKEDKKGRKETKEGRKE